MLVDVMLPDLACQSSALASGDFESVGNFVPVKFPSLVSFTSALQLLTLSLPISPGSNLSNTECTENGMKKLPLFNF